MGTLAKATPPNLPNPGNTVDPAYMNRLLGVLRTFFLASNAVQHINAASLNLNLDTLPTEADLANLRLGDIYRDTTASNVLKVKV